MKKTVLLIVLVMLLLITIPVAAKYYQPVGDRMVLNNLDAGWCDIFPEGPPYSTGVSSWPASTPFHIRHGWSFEMIQNFTGLTPPEAATLFGQFHKADFQLILDGNLQQPSARWRFADPKTGWQAWANIFDFKDGMTGVHEFQGIWILPICPLNEIPAKDCPDVNELVTVFVCTVEVTFTD